MAPKNVNSDIDPQTAALLRQARAANNQMRNIGMPVTPLEPQVAPVIQPLTVNKPVPVKTADPVAYENFVEITYLPSKGLFYSNKVFGQPLKMEDILQVQTMDDDNLITNLGEIFSRRIRGVTSDEITVADELFLALWLRATSFPNSDHPADGFACTNEECEFVMKDPAYTVKFQQITFDAPNMPDDLYEHYKTTGIAEDILASTGQKVAIEIRRRYHTRLIHDILDEDYYSKDILPSKYYRNLLRIASITHIDGIEDLRERAVRIGNLETSESYELIKLINKYSLSAEPVVNHICPACGEVISVRGYPFRYETYLPADY